MPPFRLNRRAVLRGAGSVAIALPWLEIMRPERSARAADGPPRRFITVFTPGGTVLENWRPTGTESEFVLSPILSPLEPVRERLMVVDGLAMTSAVGEQNQSGMIAWLTGTAQSTAAPGFAGGPSIDQVLASRLSAGRRLPSLQVAVRWGTGKARGLPSPINIANFADTPTFDPIPPQLDPVAIWQTLFGALEPQSPELVWDRSILDAVGSRYQRLAQRLGAEDRQRLEAHLDKIRALEQRLGQVVSCTPPQLVDTSDYDPAAGLLSTDTGDYRDLETDAAIPKVCKLMTDMLVMALSCDITAVASLQFSDTEAKHTFPWLGLTEHMHFYMNDGGYHPAELTIIYEWYSKQHAYLIEQLASAPGSGGGSVLDESIVFFGSQMQSPHTHSKANMPFLLAGSGGGLKTNRWVRYDGESHNDLLLALVNLCGDTRTTFGTPEHCTGPLGRLT
jgi:hypothetical protein